MADKIEDTDRGEDIRIADGHGGNGRGRWFRARLHLKCKVRVKVLSVVVPIIAEFDDKTSGNDIVASRKSEGKGRNASYCGNTTSSAVIDVIRRHSSQN